MNTQHPATTEDTAGKSTAADHNPPPPPTSLGEAILQSFHTTATAHTDGPSSHQTTDSRVLPETATAIVDRILVAPAKGAEVIHLKLREDIIPGTEILLSREGARLEIRLRTDDPTAYQFLREQMGQLRQQLRDRLPENTPIRLSLEQADREQNQGRSKGYRSWPEEWND